MRRHKNRKNGEIALSATKKKKEDRRSAYSKKMIREALYQLMQEKPLNKITVKEICEVADVNRSTFYAYYQDIYDLHEKILKEFFVKQREVIRHIKAFLATKEDITALTTNDFYEITYYYVTTVKEDKELYKLIFNRNSTSSGHLSFDNLFFRVIDENLPDELHSVFRRSFMFVSGGTSGLLIEWLKDDCGESPEKLARTLAYFYNGVFNGHKFAKNN